MPYTKRPDLEVDAGWIAVELDTGHTVAVTCERKRVASGVAYHAIAKAIDWTGSERRDSKGQPLRTELKHAVPVAQIEEAGDCLETGDGCIAREVMLAVLGEPCALPLPDIVLSAVSIRVSLIANELQGAADADSLL